MPMYCKWVFFSLGYPDALLPLPHSPEGLFSGVSLVTVGHGCSSQFWCEGQCLNGRPSLSLVLTFSLPPLLHCALSSQQPLIFWLDELPVSSVSVTISMEEVTRLAVSTALMSNLPFPVWCILGSGECHKTLQLDALDSLFSFWWVMGFPSIHSHL